VNPARFLVAHRGDQGNADENTLAAFSAAAGAGACFLECDIQFSKDFIPLVLHNKRLKKSRAGEISRLTYSELLGKTTAACPLLTFKALLQWLQQHPDITLFTEIKPPVLRRKSPMQTAQAILSMIPEALQSRIVLISQSALLVEACSDQFAGDVGWVAERHRVPDSTFTYLFLPASRAGEAITWQQQGMICAVYTVDDVGQAKTLLSRGIDLIETNHFGRMKKELGADT